MGQARLREALQAGGPSTQKEKGPPVADGILTVTPDTPEALEWKSRRSAIDSAGTSSSFLEDPDEPQPHSLYGKFTWKIENFSEISKRELRSTVFEVGNYKWYRNIHENGLLLLGWSHFAQFTIAVVNKDPKKSKYSDTLHRFCKKEHDWGWKKFMELSKVLEGFTVANTLVIKAQVQVIRDRPSLPFRCLDPQYRRELVRVYLTNVEGICRRFVDEKRESLLRIRETAASFKAYWISQSASERKLLVQHKGADMLKGLVKRFFNEKEVTSTLVMDALFSGCKQVEEATRGTAASKGKRRGSSPPVTIHADRNIYSLGQDVLPVLERACQENIPVLRDEKPTDALMVRHGPETDDYNRDFIERDEKRLADLGRRTVEMYVIAHIIAELEEHHVKFEKYKMQDALIQEEEEGQRLDKNKAAAKAAADKEKKQRKKDKRKAKEVAEVARREAEVAERATADQLKRSQDERQQADCRRLQEAADQAAAIASETATASRAASSSAQTPTPGPSNLHTPTQTSASSCNSNPDPTQTPSPGPSATHVFDESPTPGPSSIQNPAPLTVGRAMLASKEAAAEAAAKGLPTSSGPDPADGPSSSSRIPEAFASAHSSLTDLPAAADATDAAPTTATADSEEEDFSCNGDDTDSLSHEDSGQIRGLHAQVSSLKDQVSTLHTRADMRDMELEAAHGQIAMRDGRIRALEMQLRRAEEERSSASAALAAQKEELRQKERELAEKDAEISALKTSSSTRQHAQQQQHWRLQRVGSVASTTLSAAPEESCARSTASSDSQPPPSPTSSIDALSDSFQNGLLPRYPSNLSQPPQDNGFSSHSQRTETPTEAASKPAIGDKGRPGSLEDRTVSRAAGVAGTSAAEGGPQSRAVGRGQQLHQPAQPAGALHNSEAVAAATAAAAAALRPSNRGNTGRPGQISQPMHAKPQHVVPSTSHAAIPNGIPGKAQQLKGSAGRGLNGNAPSFIPASVAVLPSISSTGSGLSSGGSGMINGHASHISYRNAAAGVPASAAMPASTSLGERERGPSSQGSMSSRQSVSSMLHEAEVSTPTSPAVTSKGLANGEKPYVQLKAQQPTSFRLASPESAKGAPVDASNLEDFAHMGLIDDLLA